MTFINDQGMVSYCTVVMYIGCAFLAAVSFNEGGINVKDDVTEILIDVFARSILDDLIKIIVRASANSLEELGKRWL